ncbi:MAG: carbon storage regulator [Myxococcota bacterium]
MLIIARRKGQRVNIGPDVQIVVTEVTRGSVKLGIVAPARTAILRGELHDAVESANREAAKTVSDPTELALPLPAGVGPWGKAP